MVSVPRVGVLALQGDYAAHAAALRRVGAEVSEVRRTVQLDGLDGLVLPGGESTALLRLMEDEPWFDALRRAHARGTAVLGTCAGVILLAREVTPDQPSLGLLDVAVARNGFGRQIDSFETTVSGVSLPEGGIPVADLRVAFIRAPRIRRAGAGVDVLARHAGEPVLVRQGDVLGATFHPEVAGDDRLHAAFVCLVGERARTSP